MGTWRAEGRGRRGCSTPGSDQMLPQLRTPKDSIYLTRCLLLLTFSYMAKQFGVQNSVVLPAITVKRFCIISQKALTSLRCLPAPLRTAEVAMISAAAPRMQQTRACNASSARPSGAVSGKFCYAIKSFTLMVWRGFCAVRARVPSCLAANECRCAKNTVPGGRRNELDELPPGESYPAFSCNS